MIVLKKDGKSPTWIITTTDAEGFHKQLNVTADELDELTNQWNKYKRNYETERNRNRTL
jgi:hypothetical protein